MNFGSVCSGIEAASTAWIPLGWRAAFFSEIDAFPCAVLKARHPETPNFGDMTKFKEWPDAVIDVLVGGTPCQSFSVAGLRKGLADPRGNLMLTYLAIADRYRPVWLVWENVPGVLSDSGNAFGAFLGGLAELGYGFAYRILDAQYCGVPQRRRRVFVVGCLGDWRRAAAVLFERASLRGDPAPSRQAGERPAPTISARTKGGGGLGTDFDLDGGLIHAPEIARCVATREGTSQDWETTTMVAHSLRADGFDASEDGTGRGTPLIASTLGQRMRGYDDSCMNNLQPVAIQERAVCENPDAGPDGAGFRDDGQAYTLEARTVPQAVAFDCKASGQSGFGVGDVASTMRAMGHANTHQNGGGHQAVQHGMQVRRLTPRECERLQGFPDDYTLITVRGKLAADGPRYKALGNSMAVPVMAWIGERIQMVHELTEKLAEVA